MNFIDEKIVAYAETHSEQESELLKEIREWTLENMAMHVMLSGRLISSLLKLFARLTRAETLFDIGTFTGYSAVSLAEATPETAKIYTFDRDENVLKFASQFFEKGGFQEKIIIKKGEVLPTIKRTLQEIEKLDLVFLDADKANYLYIFKECFPYLRSGGIFIVDNVLWSGRVMENPLPGPLAEGIKKLNDYVKTLDNVHKVFLPIRDGVYLIYKL